MQASFLAQLLVRHKETIITLTVIVNCLVYSISCRICKLQYTHQTCNALWKHWSSYRYCAKKAGRGEGIRVYYIKCANVCSWFCMNCFRTRLFRHSCKVFSFTISSIHYFIIYYIILVIVQWTHFLNWGRIRSSCDVHDAIWAFCGCSIYVVCP